MNSFGPRLFAAALAGTLALSAPSAWAQGKPSDTMSPEQRKAIEGVVRDYLLEHPEILQEAIAVLERRAGDAQRTAQESALKESRDRIFSSGRDYVLGNPNGDVTLVEFFDYNCGYCKRALGDVQSLVKSDPKLRVVLKDFPVLGPGSVEAARLALAARAQLKPEKMADFHQKLLESRGQVNGERTIAVAKEFGLDIARLQKDAEGDTVRETLAENVELGDKLGLTGTPAWIVGDGVIVGAVGLEPLRQAVGNVRKCGKTDCGA